MTSQSSATLPSTDDQTCLIDEMHRLRAEETQIEKDILKARADLFSFSQRAFPGSVTRDDLLAEIARLQTSLQSVQKRIADVSEHIRRLPKVSA